MNNIDFEKDQTDVIDHTQNINSLANQVKKLRNLKDQLKRQYTNEQRQDYIQKLQFQQAVIQLEMQTMMQAQAPPGQPGQPPGQPGAQRPQGPPPSMRNNNGVVTGAESGYDLFRGTTPPNNTRAPGEPRPGARG